MAIDMYSTRAQLAAIELMPRENSFLYDSFVKDMGTCEDKKAIYDFRKGGQWMAPFVVPGTGGVLMGRKGYETREIGFCTIAPERIIGENDLDSRTFGEQILGAMTPEQREKKLLVQDQMDMRKAIQRRREWMAWKVLVTGKLDIFRYTNEGRDKETTLVADYGFTNHYTPTDTWDSSTANIDRNMHEIFDMVQDGLGDVDKIVMDPESADAMLNNSKYIKQYDMKNAFFGEIRTKYRGQGVRFIGYNSDGVEMYSFGGKFVDDDGLLKPFLPKGTVIAGSADMLKCLHGPVTQVEGWGEAGKHRTYIKKEVPKRVSNPDANYIKNRITSCPTIIPFNVDAWVVAHVL